MILHMELLRLLAAHFIGDFFTQTDKGVEQKERKVWKSPYLYLHALIHFILVWLFLWELNGWLIALIISSSHLLIDGIKLSVKKKKQAVWLFFADQAAHIAVILLVWALFYKPGLDFSLSIETWIILFGLLLVTNPAAYAIGAIMKYWSDSVDMNENSSLQDAGKTIGILERVFVYLAVIIGSPEIAGFLIAAKSVFRFGDITRAKNRKLTEYILIGTLLSFLISAGVGLIVKYYL